MILAGSVRNGGDEERVRKLRELAMELEIEVSCVGRLTSFTSDLALVLAEIDSYPSQDNVEFAVNVPFSELIALFGKACVGLHTMVDEHFGITVVEFMVSSTPLPLLLSPCAAFAFPPAHRRD